MTTVPATDGRNIVAIAIKYGRLKQTTQNIVDSNTKP